MDQVEALHPDPEDTPRDAPTDVASLAHNLFLSFASEHRALVDLFRRHAKDRLSLLSFYDRPMSSIGSHDWKHYAEDLIRSCSATLCLVGHSTYDSAPVNWEIRKSAELGKPVLAVCLEPITLLPPALLEIGVSPLPLDVDIVVKQLK